MTALLEFLRAEIEFWDARQDLGGVEGDFARCRLQSYEHVLQYVLQSVNADAILANEDK